MNPQLCLAEREDLARVSELVRAYHAFEGIERTPSEIEAAIEPLLGASELGRIWLICLASEVIGYVAVCFGYSIEFLGRDAFVDEIFIAPAYRGHGFGKKILAQVKTQAAALGVKALHLEVARDNQAAQGFYRTAGFTARERFFLMSVNL